MEYLLLIYENEKRFSQGYEKNELGEYQALSKEFSKSIQAGKALQATKTAKTMRVRDGKPLVSDGPFAETKEQLGGFYLIDANDMKDAMKMAVKIPAARFGCVEVRPIMKFS